MAGERSGKIEERMKVIKISEKLPYDTIVTFCQVSYAICSLPFASALYGSHLPLDISIISYQLKTLLATMIRCGGVNVPVFPYGPAPTRKGNGTAGGLSTRPVLRRAPP